MSVSQGSKEREINPRGGYNYNLYGNSSVNATNPYQCFLDHLEADQNPNFLRYTLLVLEKTAMAQQADLFKAIREKMEEKYNLKDVDVWSPPGDGNRNDGISVVLS